MSEIADRIKQEGLFAGTKAKKPDRYAGWTLRHRLPLILWPFRVVDERGCEGECSIGYSDGTRRLQIRQIRIWPPVWKTFFDWKRRA